VIDTGGYVEGSDDVFEEEIRRQVELAIGEADTIIFMVDVKDGLTSMDKDVAQLLRKSKKKVFLAANKVDNTYRTFDINEFYELGLGEVYGLSSINGSGTGELLDEVVKEFKDTIAADIPDLPRIAVVGRPNVGKSSLINALLGEDRHFYSVPYQYIAKQVSLVYDTENVEIYLDHQRIASHKRNYRNNGYSTIAEHMPSNHRHYVSQQGWDEDYFLKASSLVGENTLAAMRIILQQKTFIEQTYRTCRGTLALAKKYSNERLEAACSRALFFNTRITYGSLQSILEKNMDKQPLQTTLDFSLPEHDNLRGPGAYG